MSTALDELTVERFARLVGDRFAIEADEGPGLTAELLEATAARGATARVGREPFALLFRGPPQPLLAQRIYRVAHERGDLPPLDLFIVPVSSSAEGVCYEAVFS